MIEGARGRVRGRGCFRGDPWFQSERLGERRGEHLLTMQCFASFVAMILQF